jgi:hypothetical protein
MRIFIAFLIGLSVACYWDAEYNHVKLFDGLHSMARSMSHSMGR